MEDEVTNRRLSNKIGGRESSHQSECRRSFNFDKELKTKFSPVAWFVINCGIQAGDYEILFAQHALYWYDCDGPVEPCG